MNLKEKIQMPPDSLRVVAFGLVFMGTLLMISKYLPIYLTNNPPVCKQQGVVQEIIALSGNRAKVKLVDGSIRMQPIENYDNDKKVFKDQIETNQTVCLEYENPVIYKLYRTLNGYTR